MDPDHTSYLSTKDQSFVQKALKKARELHSGQTREAGGAFIEHPIAVAAYLAELEADAETLAAALLHDVIEDTAATLIEIEQEFGPTVAMLVDGVTKLSKAEYKGSRDEWKAASLRKMLMTAVQDIRVIIIKLADRWHNAQTLASFRPKKQERIALETLEIYVPFARMAGLWNIKSELETICFPLAFPEDAERWHKAVEKMRAKYDKERTAFIKRINSETSNEIEAKLYKMTDYEIYNRLQGNMKRLENTRNIDSVLITVLNGNDGSPLECYRVMGDIHSEYPIQMNDFRDYISITQANGYQALHTTVFLSENHKLRLRIQTEGMYDYTNKRKLSGAWIHDENLDMYSSLQSLHSNRATDQRYMSNLKNTVLSNRITVFTPSGEFVHLPEHATGIDFAFALNPDHISYLKAIELNSEIVEATHEINDGDTVDLILDRNGNADVRAFWTDKAQTAGAKERVRKSLKHAPKTKRQRDGIHALEVECRKQGLPTWQLFNLDSVQRKLLIVSKKESFSNLTEAIGSGYLSARNIAEEYRNIIQERPDFFVQLGRLFGRLPGQRVLDKNAKIISIDIHSFDRPGMIYDISRCFAERNMNIARFKVYAIPGKNEAVYQIKLESESYEQFSNLYDALLQIPDIKKILRNK